MVKATRQDNNDMKYSQDKIETAIRRADWFEELHESAVRQLASRSFVKTYCRDQFLYLVGERTKYVFCVLAGRVRISVTSSMGQEFVLTDMHAGSWLGEASLIGAKNRVLEACVLDESDILLIPAQAVAEVGQKAPIVYKKLFSEHMRRTQMVYELLAGMLFYPLKARLAGRFLDLLEKHGVEGPDGLELDMNMSQLDFARMSMGSRQRVNKIFRDWVKDGVLLKQGDKYVVTNLKSIQKEIEVEEV